MKICLAISVGSNFLLSKDSAIVFLSLPKFGYHMVEKAGARASTIGGKPGQIIAGPDCTPLQRQAAVTSEAIPVGAAQSDSPPQAGQRHQETPDPSNGARRVFGELRRSPGGWAGRRNRSYCRVGPGNFTPLPLHRGTGSHVPYKSTTGIADPQRMKIAVPPGVCGMA